MEKMKIEVSYQPNNQTMMDMLEIVRSHVGDIVYEEEERVVCFLDGFETMIYSSGSILMEKEIEVQNISEEIKSTMSQYMRFRELDSRFNYPWTISVKLPTAFKDSCLKLLESEGKHVEVTVIVGRTYFKMSGEKFVNEL